MVPLNRWPVRLILLANCVAASPAGPPSSAPSSTSCPQYSLSDGTTEVCDTGCDSLAFHQSVPDLLESAASFPAYGARPADDPLTVNVGVIFLRLDSIEPQNGRWTVRVQVDMYWDAADCETNQQKADVCSQRLGDLFYFGLPQQVLQPLGATRNAALTGSGMFEANYERGSCLKGDFVDATFMLGYSFVPQYFPFETYRLDFRLKSFVDNTTVRFNVVDELPNSADLFESDMPDNWQSDNGLVCKAIEECLNISFRGGERCWSEVRCSIVVSASSDGYLLTVVVFWFITMLANMLGGMGIVAAAERGELRGALVERGVFSASFLLAYVFVVPPRPRDLPLLDVIPSSTTLFILGLTNLIVCTLWSYTIAQTVQSIMRNTKLHSKWWHVFVYHEKIAKQINPKADTTASIADLNSGVSSRELVLIQRQERIGQIDLVVWLLVNIITLLTGAFTVGLAEVYALAQQTEYKDEINAS